MTASFEEGRFSIGTDASAEDVRRVLKQYAPWRHRIDFSCGVSTLEFETFQPFDALPTWNIQTMEQKIGPLSGYRRALDVGCNAGHNSAYLEERYGMEVVGIDISQRHVKVSTELARLAGLKRCCFLQASAETFTDPEGFDLIIHFGTLYHLRNPVLAIETALKNLRPGGMLLLETQAYGGRRELRAQFINGLGGDKSNWWALGERSIIEICAFFGAHAERIDKFTLKKYFRQSRLTFKITKPPATAPASR